MKYHLPHRCLHVALILLASLTLSASRPVLAGTLASQISVIGSPQTSITFSATEFARFLDDSIGHGEPAQRTLARTILAALNERNITLANGQIVYEASFGSPSTGETPNVPDPFHCTEVRFTDMAGRITVEDGSTFTLRVAGGLARTVLLEANLKARVEASGPLEFKYYQWVPEFEVGQDCWDEIISCFLGFCLTDRHCRPRYEPRCIAPVTIPGPRVSGSIRFETKLTLAISLAATLSANVLTVQRSAILEGSLISADQNFVNGIVDVLLPPLDPISNYANDWIKDRVRDGIRHVYFGWIDDENATIRNLINGTTTVTLPDLGNSTGALLSLLESANIPAHLIGAISQGNRRYELIACLLNNGGNCATTFLAGIAACDVTRANFLAPMTTPALFTTGSSGCQPANPAGPDTGQYFADAACQSQIAYRPPSFDAFCQETLTFVGPNPNLGNATWAPDVNQVNDRVPGVPSRMWTLPYGTQLKLAADTGTQLPFMKRVNYKTITNTGRGSGVCQLEMRVYKKDVAASNLRPILAIHGGSWAFRGFAFAGLEAEIAQLTDQGYIVFAPFYRLNGDADGNIECNGAKWFEVISDAESALAWVRQFGPALGAKSAGDGRSMPVAVLGQSAGAHLSGYLAVYHPSDVQRGFLMYAPLDAQDFLSNFQFGFDRATGILKRFCTVTGDTPDPECIARNSFYAQVNAQTPPLFLLHGTGDTLVPYQQSSRMCSQFGNAAVGGLVTAPGAYDCGRMSKLRLVDGADHALDALCIPGVFCPGRPENVATIKAYLAEGRKWLSEDLSWLIPILNLLLDD